MLINMQYSRSTGSVINFQPYLEAMEHAADVADVYLFRRFEMMDTGARTACSIRRCTASGRRAALASQVYDCIGQRLADAIEHGAR